MILDNIMDHKKYFFVSVKLGTVNQHVTLNMRNLL